MAIVGFVGGKFFLNGRSLGKGSQSRPTRLTSDYQGLLGLIRAYWEDLAPLPWLHWPI